MGGHTPTPWHFSDDGLEIYSEPEYRSVAQLLAVPEADANAAFIVEAVNSYEQSRQTIEALVGALTKCQSALATIVDPKAIPTTTVMHAWAQAVEAETGARSALLLAGEKNNG